MGGIDYVHLSKGCVDVILPVWSIHIYIYVNMYIYIYIYIYILIYGMRKQHAFPVRENPVCEP